MSESGTLSQPAPTSNTVATIQAANRIAVPQAPREQSKGEAAREIPERLERDSSGKCRADRERGAIPR